MEKINWLLRLGRIMLTVAVLALVAWPVLHYVFPESQDFFPVPCMSLFFLGFIVYSLTHLFIVPMKLDKVGKSIFRYTKEELSGREFYFYSQPVLGRTWLVPK